MTQVRLAEALGISASYLNLLEHGRRPVTAALLIRLAQILELDLSDLAMEEDAALAVTLHGMLAEQSASDTDISIDEVRDLVANHPAAARAMLAMHERHVQVQGRWEGLAAHVDALGADGTSGGIRTASDEVIDLLERRGNHFPELDAASETLWESGFLDRDDLRAGLRSYLEDRLGVRIIAMRAQEDGSYLRRFDPDNGELFLSRTLHGSSRNFQLAHQIALLEHGHLIDQIITNASLSGPIAERLTRIACANYFAAALIMPYETFYQAARELRYDVELLSHRFRTSFEQTCHRLTTLRRPGQQGIAFHMIRVDVAGNISKQFSGTDMRFTRYSSTCARWNVHRAFLSPGTVQTQVSRMPDDKVYFNIARTVDGVGVGHHRPRSWHAIGLGCAIAEAHELVYSDGIALASGQRRETAIGITCRLCERMDCAQRAMPSLHEGMVLDENRRGYRLYATPMSED